MLEGTAASALVIYAGTRASGRGGATAHAAKKGGLTFPSSRTPSTTSSFSNAYDYGVVCGGADPLVNSAPEFDFENQSPSAQTRQFGYNDYVTLLPSGTIAAAANGACSS